MKSDKKINKAVVIHWNIYKTVIKVNINFKKQKQKKVNKVLLIKHLEKCI